MSSELADRKRNLYAAMLIVGIAGAGVWAVLYATQPGIGLYSDSTYYFSLARRLLAGDGYTILDIQGKLDPVPRYPFVYPTLLALPGLLGQGLLSGARWMGSIFFFINVLLIGRISYCRCAGSVGAAAFAAILACASFDMLSYHSIALSDAPSLLFVLLGFTLVDAYLQRPSPVALVGAAAATGLAFATRYAAAAFVFAGFAVILLWGKDPFLKRLREALLFGLGSSLLMILWVFRNLRYATGATGRHLSIHPVIDIAQFKELLFAVSAWASDGGRSASDIYVRGPIVAAVVLITLLAALRESRIRPGVDIRQALPLIYIFSYVVVLALSSIFLQADLFLDSLRILLPIHAFMIILVVSEASRVHRGLTTRRNRAAVGFLCLVACAFFLAWMLDWARTTREDGQGYASSTYTDSEILQTIRGLPKDARFYSNLPWPIGIYTERLWSLLPTRIDITTLGENRTYRAQLEELARTMREHDVYLAWYKQGDEWYSFPSLKDVQTLVPLRVVAETEEGTIYAAAAP